jgi:protein-tyrosine-phosphatase
MAGAIMKQLVSRTGADHDWRIESAGTWAIEGAPAASGSELALLSRGIEVGNHHSRGVTLEILREFDLILTMERGHQEALKVEFPEVAHRIYRLSEMVNQEFDIPDPIGGSRDDFEETVEIIDNILTEGFDRIYELAGPSRPKDQPGG